MKLNGVHLFLVNFPYACPKVACSLKVVLMLEIYQLPLGFRYDQTLFEDETKNRMMETKELFDWVLKQACFEVFLCSSWEPLISSYRI